ncbi:MAG: hypothetical protein HY656_06980 [Acidobacteria bacterium]|nr:hypothetical protein [Acidobacteriota bacterium]
MQSSSPLSPDEFAAFNRVVKVLYFALFATVGIYWFVLELIARQREPAELGLLKTVLQALAAVTLFAVLYLRFARIGSLVADPAAEPTVQLARLRMLYILCFTLAESVALYGFVLRILGGAREEAIPFFLGSGLLFVLCYPRPRQLPGGSS